MTQKITAADVVRLLAAKHSKDLFVAECKDGPSQLGSHVRMDAWVMPRSWAHPEVTAYEVKVARGDFLRDDKWPQYLPLCNLLYFVAPKDVISRDEVPAECGLLEVSKNCKRLITRKKAPTREVEIPEEVFRYVLMCRATIRAEKIDRPPVEEWAQWLRDKNENYGVGWDVARKIRQLVDGQVDEIRSENAKLRNRIADVEAVEAAMVEMGITDLPRYGRERQAREALARGSAAGVIEAVEKLQGHAAAALRDLRQGDEQGLPATATEGA